MWITHRRAKNAYLAMHLACALQEYFVKRPTANRLALVMLGSLVFSGAALAQEPESGFVVSSSRASGFSHTSIPGVREEVISISQRVSYADLNLASTSDSREMEARVRSTARTLCEKLDHSYPLSGVQLETCVRNTVSKGMADVRIAIAAAEKKQRTAAVVSQK
jgi:UrcA family protein